LGSERPIRFLSPEQARDLVALAERARRGLSQFAGHQTGYDPEGVQLLDEWIHHTLQRWREPPVGARLLWASLMGEMFRRRHEGWWALQDGELVIVCPTSGGKQRIIPVQAKLDRRIASGMSESLTYFYDITCIELKLG
jgi:hypothetical protein